MKDLENSVETGQNNKSYLGDTIRAQESPWRA